MGPEPISGESHNTSLENTELKIPDYAHNIFAHNIILGGNAPFAQYLQFVSLPPKEVG